MGSEVIDRIEAQEIALQRRVQARAAVLEALRRFDVAARDAGFEPDVTYDGSAAIRIGLDLGALMPPGMPDVCAPPDVAALPEPPSEVAPEPAPQTRPAHGAEARDATPPAYATGPWTADEERTALRMLDRGKTGGQIATRLNRPGPGTYKKLKALQERRAKASVGPAAKSTAVIVAKPKAGDDPVTWTPALDLELCDAVFNGVHLVDLAVAMDIPDAVLSARWRSLYLDGATRSDQAARIEALRAEVAAHE
ncbi:hypothetical protein SAMN04488238_103323 [Roseicitreum antarcticum]|uniref:GcrA cell cycle regulator n=2 Tax=Roseicitreum antarcticum TaxID=564137 RepID=A0A1H2WCF8_9RHOB|nr:hypothetical protein SAMN04488238_103323 [Roseicitreum antarcticum]